MKTSFFPLFIIFIISLFYTDSYSQKATVTGYVSDNINNKPVQFATVLLENTNYGAITDSSGKYRIENVPPGTYNISCSIIGYEKNTLYEVSVTTAKTNVFDFSLKEDIENIDELKITAPPFNKTEESPVSLRTVGSTEIFRSPGGNRDISKVIQTLPGVGATVSFRNDLIVRGGAPNENRFFLDGIEVPNINHFATQGSSGGPVGMINVLFIREVDFYSGAFPANRGNALSSVMEFKQINGNEEKLAGTIMSGSSDVGITLDGPMGGKSTFILSARRSYYKTLFKLLALPFLPTYNDIQYKQTIKLNDKNRITFIGLGAIDDFSINTSVNDNLKDSATIERNEYILGYLPVNTQWNYTVGANYKHFGNNNFYTIAVSRNHLSNKTVKYFDNTELPQNLLLDYNSQEIENKIRAENTISKNKWKLNVGLGYENVLYTNSTFKKLEYAGLVRNIDFVSRLPLNKLSAFSQVSKKMLNNRVSASLGLRTDICDFSDQTTNPLKQLSPRLSVSLLLTEKLFFNANAGRYFQLPAYTLLGYRDSTNTLVNKFNELKYINNNHLVAGLEYNPDRYLKITLEGFYKQYYNYPFLLNDSISLGNLGSDFGVIGNEPANSDSRGRSYGIEFFIQKKLSKSFYGLLSYTLFRSKFSDNNDEYRSSSWDNRHILNITAGNKFKKNWEAGIKFRLLGGAPYTPYNIYLSSTKTIWDITGQGIFDWNQINALRLPLSHAMDIRVDKRLYFKKWAVDIYVDIQNVYNAKANGIPYLNVERDASGNPVTDPSNPAAYKTYLLESSSSTIIPSIGLMAEF